MLKTFTRILMIGCSTIGLLACSDFNLPWQSQNRVSAPMGTVQGNPSGRGPVASGGQVGGHIALAMDSIDRSKLSHALDNPLGRSTTWKNQQSGTTYTVTPTQKVVLNDNPFCRRYTVKASNGTNSKESQGTACVGTDSSWHAVSE